MSEDEVLALPVTTDLATAARALGLGVGKARELARDDEFPVPVLRLGRKYRVRAQHLREYVGVTPAEPNDPAGERDKPSVMSSSAHEDNAIGRLESGDTNEAQVHATLAVAAAIQDLAAAVRESRAE